MPQQRPRYNPILEAQQIPFKNMLGTQPNSPFDPNDPHFDENGVYHADVGWKRYQRNNPPQATTRTDIMLPESRTDINLPSNDQRTRSPLDSSFATSPDLTDREAVPSSRSNSISSSRPEANSSPMNTVSDIRQRNILGPQGQKAMPIDFNSSAFEKGAEPLPSRNPMGTRNSGDLNSTLDQVSGEQPANKAYRQYLADQPNEKDYSPSKMQRIAAILAGVSTSIRSGGGEGLATTKHFLDEPYDSAMNNWKVKGDRLGKAAELEEKDFNNRVKTYRDFEESQRNAARDASTADLQRAQISNYQSQIDDRKDKAGTTGWNFNTNALDGTREAVKINPRSPSGFDKITFGQVAQTPGQRQNSAVQQAGRISNITEGRENRNADRNSNLTLKRDQQMADYRANIAMNAHEKTEAARQARDASNPNHEFAARAIALRDMLSSDDEGKYSGKINLQQLTWDPSIDKDVKAELSKYAPKVEAKPTTPKETPTPNAPIRMMSPDGKPGTVKPEDVDKALAKGYKKI